MAIYNFTTEHLTVPDTQSTVISIVQEVRNEVSLIPDVIKPVIQSIFCAVGGALFTYAYGFFTQQKSYKDGYIDGRIDGYNKGYSEGFNTGYNKEIAFIAGAACVGAAVGAAAAIYYTQCRQQNTQIANAQTNQVTSNNLALVE